MLEAGGFHLLDTLRHNSGLESLIERIQKTSHDQTFSLTHHWNAEVKQMDMKGISVALCAE